VDPGLAAEMAAAGVDRCDLEAVEGASLDEARLLELSAAGRPFVVRNLTDRWAAHARWSPGYLRRRYGGLGSGDRQKAGSIKSFGLAIVDKADAEARATLTLDAYLRSLASRSDFEFLFGVRPPPCPSRRSSEPRNGHTTAAQRPPASLTRPMPPHRTWPPRCWPTRRTLQSSATWGSSVTTQR